MFKIFKKSKAFKKFEASKKSGSFEKSEASKKSGTIKNLEKQAMVCILLSLFSFFSFGKQKVLDLGAIEIKGEIRRPNVKLVHSKKYFNKAIDVIAGEELKKFEKELLKPAKLEPVKKRK